MCRSQYVVTGLIVVLAACLGQEPTASTPASKGTLVITVNAPPGVSAAIVVTGPYGYSHAVTASTALHGLEDGTYTIAASTVVVAASTYLPTPTRLVVEVGAADSVTTAAVTTAAVSYVLADGLLALVISGLPTGAAGSVTIAGPAGFSRTATASQTFEKVVPGVYSLSASNVLVAGDPYEPTPLQASLNVVAATVPAVFTIRYAPPAPVARVSISPLQKTFAMIPGMVTPAVRLHASVVDSTGTPRAGRLVTWTSDDEAVATVDSTGLVEAVGPGATGITATSGGISARAVISVLALSGPPPISGTWALSVSGSSSCHGSGAITIGQPVDSGYSPATASLRGSCNGGGNRPYSYSFSGTTAFRVALDGTSFGFTIGACSLSGQISDIFGASPSMMSGSGHCNTGWPRVSFTWSATKQ